MKKLKPCPFCGNKARFKEHDGGEFVECVKCHATGTMMFPEKCDVKALLAEQWNTRSPATLIEETIVGFNKWWEKDGLYIDPDTEDVPWFDKRRALAEAAFLAARRGLGSYIANLDTFPTEVTFANGRTVIVRDGDGGHAYLEVK